MRPQEKPNWASSHCHRQKLGGSVTALSFLGSFPLSNPCVGDGIALQCLLSNADAYRYGIEIDACRAQQAKSLGIETLQANTIDVRCPAESISLLYLNPSYDLEAGQTNNQRLELVENEGQAEKNHVAILSSEYWRDRFARDRNAQLRTFVDVVSDQWMAYSEGTVAIRHSSH